MITWFPLTKEADATMKDPDPECWRASGDCVCICGMKYRHHPYHPTPNYQGDVMDHVLCDGRLVHL